MAEETEKAPGPTEIQAKDELQKNKVSLHNARFQVKMLEALVKKLEELSR